MLSIDPDILRHREGERRHVQRAILEAFELDFYRIRRVFRTRPPRETGFPRGGDLWDDPQRTKIHTIYITQPIPRPVRARFKLRIRQGLRHWPVREPTVAGDE